MARTERQSPDDIKVTVNLGPVEVGTVDLLVEEGFYASRADFIRAATRRQLTEHKRAIDDATTRREFTMGLARYRERDLQQALSEGRKLSLRVIGVLLFAPDVKPDTARDAIEEVHVLGSVRGPEAVLELVREKKVDMRDDSR